MMRGKLILATIAIGLFSSLAAFAAGDHDHMSHTMMMMKPAEPLPGMSIYNLTSSWTNQDGKQVDSGIASRRTGCHRDGLYELQGHLPHDRSRHGRHRGPRQGIFPEESALCLLLAGFRRRYAGAPDGLRKRPRARSRRTGLSSMATTRRCGSSPPRSACATAVTLAAASTIRPSLPFSMPMGGSWRSNPTSPPTPRQW